MKLLGLALFITAVIHIVATATEESIDSIMIIIPW